MLGLLVFCAESDINHVPARTALDRPVGMHNFFEIGDLLFYKCAGRRPVPPGKFKQFGDFFARAIEQALQDSQARRKARKRKPANFAYVALDKIPHVFQF